MKVFDCKQCGKCCFGEGGIVVEPEEVEGIARFLEMSTDSFLSTRCYSRNGRVYIASGPNGFCVFFDPERQCTIHPVKPAPCSLWPFYPAILKDRQNWETAKEACPGINPECSFEEFVSRKEK